MIVILKIGIFLLILNNVQSNSQQWYKQTYRNYFNYGSFDNQSPMLHNSTEARSPLRIAWRWPFNQQNTIKVTRYPASNTQEENDMSPNDKFIFPDTEIKSDKPKIGPVPSCGGKTYCEDVSNYPMDLLNDVIKNRNLQNYESIDAMDISYRIDASLTESLCQANEQIIYPKTAENMDKQWLFIVNHPNFTQGVRIETCTKVGEGCNLVTGFAEGYVTSCEQKYIYRQLAAIVEDGSISHELFRFPASCCCGVRFVGTSLRGRTV